MRENMEQLSERMHAWRQRWIQQGFHLQVIARAPLTHIILLDGIACRDLCPCSSDPQHVLGPGCKVSWIMSSMRTAS